MLLVLHCFLFYHIYVRNVNYQALFAHFFFDPSFRLKMHVNLYSDTVYAYYVNNHLSFSFFDLTNRLISNTIKLTQYLEVEYEGFGYRRQRPAGP